MEKLFAKINPQDDKTPEADCGCDKSEENTLLPEQPDFRCKDMCKCCGERAKDVTFNPCEEFKEFTVQDVFLHCEGRILKVKVQFRDICRGRSIRVAVILMEKFGPDHKVKGMRVCEFTVPGPMGGCMNNMTVGDFCFVLPEDHMCCPKEVAVKVVAHYSSFPDF